MTGTILVIDDEPDLRRLLRIILERARYDVVEAAEGRTGLRLFHERRPDLVLLDIGLPGLDGWQVLERIRELSTVPVVLLTARGLETEKVRGLNAGADDYITKPFGRAELVARVHAALRRSPSEAPATVEMFDDGFVSVDFVARRVRVEGSEVAMTPLEYRLLSALVRHRGHVLSLEQLLEYAWDDPSAIGSDRVKFAVLRLRRKLGGDATNSPIEAVRGFGYRYRAQETTTPS